MGCQRAATANGPAGPAASGARVACLACWAARLADRWAGPRLVAGWAGQTPGRRL